MADTLDNLVRLARWQLDEKRRELAQLESRREQLQADLEALDAEYQREQELLHDAGNAMLGMNFPVYTDRYNQQRQQYVNAIEQTDKNIARVRDEIADLYRTRKSYEQVEEARRQREAEEAAKREQAALDEVAATQHLRQQREAQEESDEESAL